MAQEVYTDLEGYGNQLTPGQLTFRVTNSDNEMEEVIKINRDGFYYKGIKVEDAHNVYERFNDWLKQAENPYI